MTVTCVLGPGQTPYFTSAEWNANDPNEGEQMVFLFCIRFDSCEVRRFTSAVDPPTIRKTRRQRQRERH